MPGVTDLLTEVLTCIFEGMPLGNNGRPGPFTLLLPSCFLESTDTLLAWLVELNL